MKFYQYISLKKIDMLHQQIENQQIDKEYSIGIDLKFLRYEIKKKPINAVDKVKKVEEIVKCLKELRLVGSIEEEKPYVLGSINLKFGGYSSRNPDVSPIAFWGSTDLEGPLEGCAFAMAGSRHNLIGESRNAPYTAHSHSLTDAMLTWFMANLPDISGSNYNAELGKSPLGQGGMDNYVIANAAYLAADTMGGSNEKYEFVARILHRSDWEDGFRGSSVKKIVLATPLYVAMTD